MRIVHVASSLEDQASGTSTVVPAFAQAASTAGIDSKLFSLGPRSIDSVGDVLRQKFEIDWPAVPILNKLQSSALMQAILMATATDIIHVHGLWGMPSIYAARAAVAQKSKLVVSPHGMLAAEALTYSPFRKKVFSLLLQNRALAAADMFHATSQTEVEDIRKAGWRQPVALIEPGIDVVKTAVSPESNNMRTILYLGRLHPIKRIGDLLTAWTTLSLQHPQWCVRIVGPDDTAEALHLRHRIQVERLERISIEPALFGAEKTFAFGQADLFVLPSQSENFAMVVAEALALGVPVICSKGAPWARLESEACGWWPDIGAEPLRIAMNTAMQLPQAVLRKKGERGRAWMGRDFSWGAVAQKLDRSYRWIVQGGERPEFIKEV